MHIGKVMARMNPRSPQLGGVGGGRPELESTDIAGALAFVPPGLGRELLCRIWWPDGAALNAKELDKALMEVQVEEWKNRMDLMVTAQIAELQARTPIERARTKAQLEACKARIWPLPGVLDRRDTMHRNETKTRYEAIREAVLFEMSVASRCAACSGRGSVRTTDGRIISCSPCNGLGLVRISDRGRAKLIGRDESTYRDRWRPVYEFTLLRCQDAYGPAHRAYIKALGI